MHCIEAPQTRHGSQSRSLGLLSLGFAALVLAGCAQQGAAPPPSPVPAPAPAAAPRPAAPAPAATPTGPAARVPLAAPTASRNKDELRRQAARRLVAAHPDGTYVGKPPDILLAVPVLEIELNADGSVKGIKVLRQPSQARDTTQLAIDAVRRAAPYGDVSKLPKPWTFVETFLFKDDRKFKPRTLDE